MMKLSIFSFHGFLIMTEIKLMNKKAPISSYVSQTLLTT